MTTKSSTHAAQATSFDIKSIIARVEKKDNTMGYDETDSFHKMILDTPTEYRRDVVTYILTSRSRPAHLAPSLERSIENAAKQDAILAAEGPATTAPRATIYHAPLANTFASNTTIALIMSVHAYNYGSSRKASLSKTIDGYRFDSLNYSGESYNDKTYKTITGALKAVLKAISYLQTPAVDFYINPDHIHELPAKLPEVMATAQHAELTRFTVGSKYIADNGTVYTISGFNNDGGNWVNCYTRPEHAHCPQTWQYLYEKGVQIFMIKQPCGELITTVRADQPVEPVEVTTQGEITAEDVNFAGTDYSGLTPVAQATSSQATHQHFMFTTLNLIGSDIANGEIGRDRWEMLLSSLGKTYPDNEKLTIRTILELNGIRDALWSLRTVDTYASRRRHEPEIRLFATWCARQSMAVSPDSTSSAWAEAAASRCYAWDAAAAAARVASSLIGWAAITQEFIRMLDCVENGIAYDIDTDPTPNGSDGSSEATDRPSEPVAEVAPVAQESLALEVAADEVAPVATTKRLEILTNSLAKKQAKLDARIAAQYARQAATNGQPLNDKRNGQSTINALEKGECSIFNQFDEIRKTEAAIKREAGKIEHCQNWMNEMPQIIKDMVASGEIIQWRKHPQYFFVKGVDKGRFSVQDGRVFGRHLSEITADQYPLFQAATSKILRALKGDSEPVEVTTQGEITESDVNFTDGEWDITPTPDGSDEPTGSGNTPAPVTHTTLKSAVALHFNADKATKSEHAYYLAFWRKLAKSNSCTLEICGQMVTITRLEKGDFAVSAQPIAPVVITAEDKPQPTIKRTNPIKHAKKRVVISKLPNLIGEIMSPRDFASMIGMPIYKVHISVAPQPEMPAPAPIDWHTIIDEIAISDFNLIDSREWADHISEAEKEFDAMMETERAEMQCDDYEAEQAIERKNSPPVPSFELLATKAPAKAKRATRAKFVQMTGMLFNMPKVSTTDLIARRAAQRKDLSDRMPPAPLFRGI